MKLLVLLSVVVVSHAFQIGRKSLALVGDVAVDAEPISPYAFSYSADAIDGGSSRQESADASGVVRGSYSVVSADGIKRIVSYIADENGFRAQVQTNEPGTESKNSADVLMLSSQPPAEEIALKYGPGPQPTLLGVKGLGLGVKGLEVPVLTNKLPFFASKPLAIPSVQTKLLETPTLIPSLESPIRLLSRIPKTLPLTLKSTEAFGQNYESF